jgi:hypothetical protein
MINEKHTKTRFHETAIRQKNLFSLFEASRLGFSNFVWISGVVFIGEHFPKVTLDQGKQEGYAQACWYQVKQRRLEEKEKLNLS